MSPATQRRYATGLDPLDRRLNGGIPVGTMLAFVTPTRTQSELLLYQLASAQPTHYLSTTCPDETEFYDRLPGKIPAENIEYEYVEPATLLEAPGSVLADVTPETYVVVDAVNALERASTREAYLSVLNTISRLVRERDCVAVLHCLTDVEHTEAPEWRQLTEKRADHVWEIRRQVSSQQITVQLLVAKARGDYAFTEPLPLLLTNRVQIDTSQRIG